MEEDGITLINNFEYEVRGKYLNLYDRVDVKDGIDSLRFLGQVSVKENLEDSLREAVRQIYWEINIPDGICINATELNFNRGGITFVL